MGKLIQARIGKYRSFEYFDMNGVECEKNDLVILEVDHTTEFGQVVSDLNVEEKSAPAEGVGKVVRKVTEGDLNQIKNNEIKAQDAVNACVRKVNERKIEMQIVKAEYAFDCSKIIFFFTAEGRVDFRGLVKDLAKIFRVRIELKQIGVRDKARVVGGCGVCGRHLCCASFIKDFHPLSIKMAKEQTLPLNPSRISGSCSRIKCCMAYEYCVYKEMAKDLPHIGEKVNTPEGKGRVKDINILKRFALVDFGEGKVKKIHYPAKEAQ